MCTHLVRVLAAAGAVTLSCVTTASAQQPVPKTAAGCPVNPAKFHACAIEKSKKFNPPRTADGQPNLQGMWDRTNTSQDIEEHIDGFGVQAGDSIVIDPPDGRIPYQPWAAEKRRVMADQYISPLASCYPPGVPRQVFAPGGNRIIQSAEYFVFLLEYSHSYRIIETGAHPHLGKNVRLWMGDSRGRWEGNTLVVDVTNSNGLTWLDNAGNFYSDALHVVERFTLVDANTIHYEARIEDPNVYARPWTMAFAMVRNSDSGYELFEQACREGNRSLEGQLKLGMKPYLGVGAPPNQRPQK